MLQLRQLKTVQKTSTPTLEHLGWVRGGFLCGISRHLCKTVKLHRICMHLLEYAGFLKELPPNVLIRHLSILINSINHSLASCLQAQVEGPAKQVVAHDADPSLRWMQSKCTHQLLDRCESLSLWAHGACGRRGSPMGTTWLIASPFIHVFYFCRSCRVGRVVRDEGRSGHLAVPWLSLGSRIAGVMESLRNGGSHVCPWVWDWG